MDGAKHQIEYKRLDEIRPYDNNPRRNDEAAKAVANSIREFGFQSPIIVDRDGVIIAGHTRYKAARRLKLQTVPVIVAGELTPEQVKALRIADNSTGEVAEWDLQLLVQELTGIDYDMADFGLNLEIRVDEEVKEDDFDAEPPEKPITQRGDIWLLGDHRVMCGDSTSPQDVERLMDGQLADLLLTDPPYNVNYEGSNGKKIENDNMAESEFRQFLLKAYSLPHRGQRVHLPRRHRRRGLPGHVPGGWLGAARLPRLGQEQSCAGPQRLPVAARALPVRLEARGQPLLHQRPQPDHRHRRREAGRSAAHEEGPTAGLGHQGAGPAHTDAKQRPPLR